MASNMGSNWYIANFPGGPGQPGAPAYGGGGADMLTARDPLDAKRMAAGFAPGASFPDGYLGVITDRQEDKTLAVLQSRLTPNSYQRGVHVGEKVRQSAYFWEPGFNPNSGLEREMKTRVVDVEGGTVMMSPKNSPSMDPVEMLSHDGKFQAASDRERDAMMRARNADPAKNPIMITDTSRAARMRDQLPAWSPLRRSQ